MLAARMDLLTAAGWGRRGRRRGAVVVDLDRGEGLGWVADLERKNGGGGGRNERKNGGGGWVENVHEDRPRVSARVGLGRWIRKHPTVVDA